MSLERMCKPTEWRRKRSDTLSPYDPPLIKARSRRPDILDDNGGVAIGYGIAVPQWRR